MKTYMIAQQEMFHEFQNLVTDYKLGLPNYVVGPQRIYLIRLNVRALLDTWQIINLPCRNLARVVDRSKRLLTFWSPQIN